MRHLLNILNFGKRDEKPSSSSFAKRPDEFDPASTLVIAGEPIPRDAPEPPAPLAAEEPDESPERLEEVVKAKRKERWHAPDLEGPEFGGLIERRGVDKRGLMPEKFKAKVKVDSRTHEPSEPGKVATDVVVGMSADDEITVESTGMFLAALDNSAITLADSGLFRIADEPADDKEAEPAFDPYDHKASR